MATRFASAIALALRLITKSGETSKIKRKTDGTPGDATKPWEPSAPTLANHDVKAVWLGQERSLITGELVKAGRQLVLVAASGMTIDPDPSVDHILRASGEKWTIQESRPLNPNGEKIIFELECSN